MWDTTEWREKTADLIKISAPIRVLQRKRTNRRCLGTDRFITQNLLRVTEAGESTSALQTGRQRPGNPMVHFQAKDSLLENFFFFFGLEMPVFLVYPGLQLIGHGPPTPCTATFFTQSPPIQRRRQRQPTPVLLPGKSHGRMRLVGCNPWGCEESDTTE